MKSQILEYKSKNLNYFIALEKICEIYERDHNISNPYKGYAFAPFIPIFDGLHKSPEFKKLGMGRGVMLFTAFTHLWSRYKQEYIFDPILAGELVDMELPDNLPIGVIQHPPFPIMYIQDPQEDEISSGWYFLLENGALIIMAIKNHTDSTEFNFKTWVLNFSAGSNIKDILIFDKRDGIASLRRALNLYLYLCSEKPDTAKPVSSVKAFKNGKNWKKDICSIIKVGERLGTFLKGNRSESSRGNTSSTQPGSSKTGHIRRAHWHHFWTGSKDNKKLILKWLHPIIVNSGETVSKISKVRKEEVYAASK